MSKQTLLLIAILAILSSLLVAIALSPQSQPKPATTQNIMPSPTQAPLQESVLTINPNPLTLPVNTPTTTLDVDIETGSNEVTAVQLEIIYDPKLITVTDVLPGNFFTNPLALIKQIDVANGRVTYALGIQPNATGRKGMGTVARLVIRGTGTQGQATQISLSPNSLVSATGIQASVMKSAKGTSILFVQQAQTTTTPSIAPSR